jgi:hypothetical protein
LKDKYPKPGEFCTLTEEVNSCFKINFFQKNIEISNEKLPLSMINRGEYNFKLKNDNYKIIVIHEHRVTLNKIGSAESEKVFLRKIDKSKRNIFKRLFGDKEEPKP